MSKEGLEFAVCWNEFQRRERRRKRIQWAAGQWALYVLLAAVGIYCAYMAYTLKADAAPKPKPAPIVCIPKAAKELPANKAAWKAERAAKIAAAGAKAPKAERAKVKR